MNDIAQFMTGDGESITIYNNGTTLINTEMFNRFLNGVFPDDIISIREFINDSIKYAKKQKEVDILKIKNNTLVDRSINYTNNS